MSHGNRLAKHDVVSRFWLLSDLHCWLFSTAVLNGSGKCEILEAGAFENIYFISAQRIHQFEVVILPIYSFILPLLLAGRKA